jgi:hypothetical protein
MICVKGVIAFDLFPEGVNGDRYEVFTAMDKEEGEASVRVKNLSHVGSKVSSPVSVKAIYSGSGTVRKSNDSRGKFEVECGWKPDNSRSRRKY